MSKVRWKRLPEHKQKISLDRKRLEFFLPRCCFLGLSRMDGAPRSTQKKTDSELLNLILMARSWLTSSGLVKSSPALCWCMQKWRRNPWLCRACILVGETLCEWGVCHSMYGRSENSLEEFVLIFYGTIPRNQMQVISLGGTYPYPLCRCTSPMPTPSPHWIVCLFFTFKRPYIF